MHKFVVDNKYMPKEIVISQSLAMIGNHDNCSIFIVIRVHQVIQKALKLAILVCNFCVIHQKFREEVAKNITVSGHTLDCTQLADRGVTGESKINTEALKKVGINPEYIRSLLRNYACVYGLILTDARIHVDQDLDEEG